MPQQELAPALEHRLRLSPEEALLYARISGGSPGAAVAMASGGVSAETYFPLLTGMLDNILSGDLPALLEGNDSLVGLGRERQRGFILYSEDFLRKTLMFSKKLSSIADAMPEETAAVERYSGLLPQDFYSKAFKALEEARSAVESNVNAKMVFCHLANVLFAIKNF